MTEKYSTLCSLLFKNISKRSNEGNNYIDFVHSVLTYKQLLNQLGQTVGLLQSRGVEKGDRIVIFSSDDKQAIILYISALLQGFVPIVLSSDVRPGRLQAILDKVTPALTFIDVQYLEIWPWLNNYFCIGIFDPKISSGNSTEVACFPAILADYSYTEPDCSINANDIATIIFTSGTTAEPKAIQLSHGNLFNHLQTLTKVFSYDDESRIFNNMALAHADGLIQGPLLALYSGALLYRPEPFVIKNLEKIVLSVKEKCISHFITVPTILSFIDRFLRGKKYFDGECFRNIISVAAMLDPNLWLRLEKKFNLRICNMYGLTETVTGGLFCGPDDGSHVIGTVGKPVDMDVKVVDDSGVSCEVGCEGELYVKGGNIFSGYFGDEDNTKQIFDGSWLKTGDLAIQDEHGFVKIVGRKKNLIISGGYTIHPEEINEALLLRQNVVGAATIAIPDKDWGELVVSVVESDFLLDETELINHCRQHLEHIKVPKRIMHVRSLPRTISGKIDLPAVRDIIASGKIIEDAETGVDGDEILVLAKSVFNVSDEQIKLEQPSTEIPAWDSLAHLNLIAAVEKKYAIEFSVDEIMQVDSLEKLCQVTLAIITNTPAEVVHRKPENSLLSDVEFDTLQKVVASSKVGKRYSDSSKLGRNVNGKKKPIYWFFNALDLELASLTVNLGDEQPIYAFYSGSGLLDKTLTTDRLADHYLNEILAQDSSETFYIGGHCRGAAVAWRIAMGLEEAGRRVEKICLLEYFNEEMFSWDGGALQLLYGQESPFDFQKEFGWPEEGWNKNFISVPMVQLTPGSHGDSFFNPPFIQSFAEKIDLFFDSERGGE